MWFFTNLVYGFCLGYYSKKFILINDQILASKQPFKLFAFLPEIYNGIDLLSTDIKPLIRVYLGFEPSFRNLNDVLDIAVMLTDFVKSCTIIKTTNGGPDFFSGIDIGNHFILFEPNEVEILIQEGEEEEGEQKEGEEEEGEQKEGEEEEQIEYEEGEQEEQDDKIGPVFKVEGQIEDDFSLSDILVDDINLV